MPGAHRFSDILQCLKAQITVDEVDLAADLPLCIIGDTDATRLRYSLEACRDVDAISKNIIVINDDVADVNADTEFDPAVRRHVGVVHGHTTLNLDGASRCIHCASEFDQHAVARGLHDATSVLDDLGINNGFSERLQIAERALFIGAHQPTITGDIRRQQSRQSPFHALASHDAPRVREI
jgi:hypothetical protein